MTNPALPMISGRAPVFATIDGLLTLIASNTGIPKPSYFPSKISAQQFS